MKYYKGMNVLTFDQSIPYFQKLFDFIPDKLSKKGEEEQLSTLALHTFLLFFPTKESFQLNKVSFTEEGITQTTLNNGNNNCHRILTLVQ